MATNESLLRLIQYCTEDHRICPVPMRWIELWRLIGEPSSKGVPGPFVLSGWAFSTDRDKRQAFLAQLQYAAEAGKLAETISFVEKLKYGEWHKCYGDLDFDYGKSLKEEFEVKERTEQEGREVATELRHRSELASASSVADFNRTVILFNSLFGNALAGEEVRNAIEHALNDFGALADRPDFDFFEGEPSGSVSDIVSIRQRLELLLGLLKLVDCGNRYGDIHDLLDAINDEP